MPDKFLEILIIFCTLFFFYPLGSIFIENSLKGDGGRAFFTKSLVGLCMASFPVAFIANFSAGAIRPLIGGLFFLNFTIGLYLLKKHKGPWWPQWQNLFPILLIGILVAWDPIAKELWNGSYFLFNRGYSYFAAQPLEMLQADYFSRLRILNIYPEEWGNYHFFNSATQALLLFFLKTPQLFSFFNSKFVVLAAIGASFCELVMVARLATSSRSKVPVIIVQSLVVVLWVALGWTLFGDVTSWNMNSTGALSVFALPWVVYFYKRKDFIGLSIFSLILGASAFRLIPWAFLLPALVVFQSIGRLGLDILKRLKIFLLSLPWSLLALFAMCGLYAISTVFPGYPGASKVFLTGEYYGSWTSLLLWHRTVSALQSIFPMSPEIAILICLILLKVSVFVVFKITGRGWGDLFQTFKRSADFPLMGLACLIFYSNLISIHIFSAAVDPQLTCYLGLGSLYYLTLLFWTLLFCENLLPLARFIIFTGFLYGLTGIGEIKGPALFVLWDVFFWSVLLFGILELVRQRRTPWIFLPFAAVIALSPQRHWHRLISLTNEDDHCYQVDTRPLENLRHRFESTKILNSKDLQDFDINLVDAYTSMLGVRYSPDKPMETGFLTRLFRQSKDWTPYPAILQKSCKPQDR